MSQDIYFRVEKGGLVPADQCASLQLRDRKYKVGDIVKGKITKPRNPKFNGLVHNIGRMVVEQIEGFENHDAHTAIKRLQLEGGVACDEVAYQVKGYGTVIQKIPRSLSFESMDEAEFCEAAKGICRTIAENYWPSLTSEQVEKMAECWVEAA